MVDTAWLQFTPLADQYANTFLENANTGYAEVSEETLNFLLTAPLTLFRFALILRPPWPQSSVLNGNLGTLLPMPSSKPVGLIQTPLALGMIQHLHLISERLLTALVDELCISTR